MGLKKDYWLLAVLAGVLLGVLAVLVLVRGSELPPAGFPTLVESPAPTPAPTSPPAPVPTAETPTPTPTLDPAVDAALAAFLENQPGRWSLCYLPLPEGEPVWHATDRNPMVSASLIKLFVMGAVYEQIENGALDHDGVYPRLHAMITVSDNPSANELIRLLGGGDAEAGMAAVNAWCERQGYAGTSLNRLMLAENSLQNYTTAADCAAFLAAVYRGECVSPAASQEMLSLLLGQTRNDRLPAGLPEGTPIAHKTGDLVGLCWADVGIVYSPGGDYILCVISDGSPGEGVAKTAMAALSRQIYELKNP